MSWAKFDDGLPTHPKFVDRTPEAKLAFFMSDLYASRELTDGKLTKGALMVVFAHSCIYDPAIQSAVRCELVSCGMWEDRDGEIWIHDYLDYNPSRDEVMAERDRIRQMRAEAGRKGMASRWGNRDNNITNDITNGITNTPKNDNKPITNALQTDNPESRIPNPESQSPVIPNPAPTPNGKVARAKPARPPASNEPGEDSKTGPTWLAYKTAYQRRHGACPLWNGKTGNDLSRFIDLVGKDKAPILAAHFVDMTNDWYAKRMHATDILISDATQINTAWETGRSMTAKEAREQDRYAADDAMWKRIEERSAARKATVTIDAD